MNIDLHVVCPALTISFFSHLLLFSFSTFVRVRVRASVSRFTVALTRVSTFICRVFGVLLHAYLAAK